MFGKPPTPGFARRREGASGSHPLASVPAPPDVESRETPPPELEVAAKGRSQQDRPFPGGSAIVLFTAAYVAAYAYSNTFSRTVPAPFWAPDAALLCALLLSRRRTWWVYLLLTLPIRLALESHWNLPIGFLLQTYANDALKALLAAWLLRRGKLSGSWFSSALDFAFFVSVAVLLVPALSAFGGAASSLTLGQPFWPTWRGWFLSDALASLLLTPLILSLAPSPRLRTRPWRRTLETVLLLAGLVFSGARLFRGDVSLPEEAVLLCLPFPFLLWAAVRYRVAGTSAALSLFAMAGIWAASHPAYETAPATQQASVLSVQLFLLVIGSSLMFLAVVLQEQRDIERNLRSTQARLARAEARSMVMVAHVAVDGRWLRVPRRLAELLGRPRRDLLGSSSHDVTHPADRAAEAREVHRLLTGGIPSFHLEKRFLRSDGTPIWVYLSRSVTRDRDGRPDHFLDYVADITERKLSEAALRRSESQLRLFAEHSPAAVAMLDADLRFVVTSSRFRKDFQRDGTPMPGLRYDEALIGFPKRWPEAFRRALEGRVESGEDDTFTKPDGTIESLRWEIMPGMGSPASAAGAFLFVELTTEKKRSERALEEVRRQLAHLTRVSTLGELSGAIAHELNQPLAAILANAQAAQSYLARGPSGASEVASILDDIVDDDLRASEVIRSLRKLLRKDGPELRMLDFNDVIREVLELAAGDLITRNVAVVRDFAPDLPPIRGDRVQLQQVILNLIVNACDAMAGSPEDDRRLRLATSVDGSAQVHAVVEDSGPGIPPEERDRIFEPFQTTKRTGLGLGLTICRSLVMAHGGRLWLTENVAGGASFHIALHRADGPGNRDPKEPPSE